MKLNATTSQQTFATNILFKMIQDHEHDVMCTQEGDMIIIIAKGKPADVLKDTFLPKSVAKAMALERGEQ